MYRARAFMFVHQLEPKANVMGTEKRKHPGSEPCVGVEVLGAGSGLLVSNTLGHSPLWQVADQREHR